LRTGSISLGIVGQLIRKLNDALGITSVVVTHDVYESLRIVDYLYFVSTGRIIAQGTPDGCAVRPIPSCVSSSTASRTAQWPHYPARPYAEDDRPCR
jgi:phospholipid/cholesterol/gamma-HCH transport system ATP-binding protein